MGLWAHAARPLLRVRNCHEAQLSPQQTVLRSSGHLALFSGEDEIFAFDRCISRLTEMQTTEYLTSKHLPPP